LHGCRAEARYRDAGDDQGGEFVIVVVTMLVVVVVIVMIMVVVMIVAVMVAVRALWRVIGHG
jgi:hypothetical protein